MPVQWYTLRPRFIGKPSSRKLERASYEDVSYRVLCDEQHPYHDSIAEFRKRHLKGLAQPYQLEG